MTESRTSLFRAVVAAGLAAAIGNGAIAQIATLDKGHQLLVNNGLQIWGAATDILNYDVNYASLENANMNGVIWGFPANGATPANGGTDIQALSPGDKWGRWTDWHYNPGAGITPQNALTAAENARKADLIAVQVGDEANQSDMESGTMTRDWLLAAGNGTATTADDVFPNSLLYVNSFFIGNHNGYANFLIQGNPDAISWDSYPFANPHGHYITPTNWLALGQQFRRHGLGSYIGATNAPPRPYGMFVQTYNDSFAVDPGEVEIRWQQFAAWTMGYKFVDAFIFSGGNNNFGNNPSGPVYQHFKETARQSRNLGPALTRLISYGYGTSIVQGKNAAGQTNPVPGDWLVFDKTNAPPNQQYLTSLSAVNLGTKNGGHPGDIYVGFFNPLHLSYGDPAGTTYFMVMNGLGGDLTLPSGQSDNTALVSETIQQITMNFDFGYTTIDSLQRLRRSDGQVEVLPLTHVAGTHYRLVFNLEGGTGDLFKYNDGHPFVGVQPVMPTVYWDNDATAAGNNTSTGAGMGGSGNWDTVSNKWHDGAANGTWAANRNPVFWGAAGAVNVVSTQAVDSLTFKTNGYTLSGSSIAMNRPFITVDSGVTATIGSAVAGGTGITKNGPGTLRLTGSNTYTSGTTIKQGAVQVTADSGLGAAPTSLRTNILLNGGTLQWGANFDLSNNRAIALGPNGGTIDTQGFSNPAGYNATAGGFRGPGDLTKLGTGTFFAAAISGGANTTWKGRLIINEGTWKIVASDGLPYNVPTADGVKADQVTLDGGTWQMGATINVTNARRGVTIAAGGGTIDTQNFNFTWAGPWAGNPDAMLNKIGSGTLRLNSSGGLYPSTYSGNFNVNGGFLHLDGGTAMGDLASINLADTAGVGLGISNPGRTETIGSLAGGGANGGNVSLNANLVTGGNNKSTTFAGVISGAGILTKTGSGTMTVTGASTYIGATNVNGGTLRVNNVSGSGTGFEAVNVNNGGTLSGTGTIFGAVTVNNAAHIAPGTSIESLNVGSLTLAAGSILDFELDTVAGDDMNDQIIVGATNGLTINGGTLNLSDAGSMTGGTYTLINYAGTLNGSLSNLALGTTPAGFSYNLVNNAANTTIDLVVTAPGIPGDFNSDGAVDAADYVWWRKFDNSTTGYDDWQRNFGRTLPGGGSSGDGFANVPEPIGTALLLIASFFLLGRRSSLTHGRSTD